MALGGAVRPALHPVVCAVNLQQDTDTPPLQAEADSQSNSADVDEFGAEQSSANACDSSANGSEVRKPEKPLFYRAVAFVMGSDDSLETPVDPGIASRGM
ncbi:hypothetical protein DL764_001290 [Monosporascus ibericus]|uniref:Uncharacterized protein n=1 Tax=Monosporascus ibericus TaxID=155417 RepID=A0A4Q4TQ33_9PEZI|nr:hypothetical protein DL764_001290 [Monosporascus ibericus]